MKRYTIEIDEKIWHFLQQNAEPFVDSPNSVLNRILFDSGRQKSEAVAPLFAIPSVSIEGLPKSLSQILEVVYEMEVNGYTRIQATNRVAKKRGTAPQTVTDKYCRQLGKRAHEIDELLFVDVVSLRTLFKSIEFHKYSIFNFQSSILWLL